MIYSRVHVNQAGTFTLPVQGAQVDGSEAQPIWNLELLQERRRIHAKATHWPLQIEKTRRPSTTETVSFHPVTPVMLRLSIGKTDLQMDKKSSANGLSCSPCFRWMAAPCQTCRLNLYLLHLRLCVLRIKWSLTSGARSDDPSEGGPGEPKWSWEWTDCAFCLVKWILSKCHLSWTCNFSKQQRKKERSCTGALFKGYHQHLQQNLQLRILDLLSPMRCA